MSGSSVLEVAIGIVFVYLVLSMVCTMINEAIATLINKRGKNLFEGIKNLLNDPDFTGLAQQIYNHGLVDGMSQDSIRPGKLTRRPSYMPSKTFALALLDVLGTHGVITATHGDLLSKAEEAYDEYTEEEAKTPQNKAALQQKKKAADDAKATLEAAETNAKTAYDNERQKAMPDAAKVAQAKKELDEASAALKMFVARQAAVDSARSPKDMELVKKASDTLEAALVAGRTLVAQLPDGLANFEAAVNRLPDGHTKEALSVLLDKTKREAAAVGTQVVHFRQEVESWFNDSMDRVGGWYKRWTQVILLAVSVIVVLALNADTIMLAERFSTDKDLRAAIVNEATKAGTNSDVNALRGQLDVATLPLGWSRDAKDSRRFPWIAAEERDQHPRLTLAGVLVEKFLGLLLSVAAVSLGAPFWFDTLSKFINLRGAGTPPGEKKKSEPQTAAAQ